MDTGVVRLTLHLELGIFGDWRAFISSTVPKIDLILIVPFYIQLARLHSLPPSPPPERSLL